MLEFTAATVTVYTTPAQTCATTREESEGGAETTPATGVGHTAVELFNPPAPKRQSRAVDRSQREAIDPPPAPRRNTKNSSPC